MILGYLPCEDSKEDILKKVSYVWILHGRNDPRILTFENFFWFLQQRTEYYQFIWREVTYPLISALPSVCVCSKYVRRAGSQRECALPASGF